MIYGIGAWKVGEIKDTPYMQEAYELSLIHILSDDVMLKSYMIEIHSNFDHHSHGKSRAAAAEEATVDFSFNRSYDLSLIHI